MLSLSSPFLIYLGVHPWHSSLYPLHPLSPLTPHSFVISALSRNHRVNHQVTNYLFQCSWMVLMPSLPIPCPLLLALSHPSSSQLLSHPFAIKGPSGHCLFISAFLDSSHALPYPCTSSLWLDLSGWSPFPHSQASITSSCCHGVIWSPTIYFSVHDGSHALPPSLVLPICLLPSCTPSSILPLTLSLSCSPPPPSSLLLFPVSITVHFPTDKGIRTLFTALMTISDNT